MIAFAAQQSGGCVKGLSANPGLLRVENAAMTYLIYIGKMFQPTNLAVFYPYPHSIPVWQACLAAATLGGISVGALRVLRTYPYFATGWFWYIGTLIPVIGLIQIGDQARADRYTYIPMVGLSIVLAWGAADLLKRWPRAVAVLAIAACLSAAALASAQVQYWKNPLTLFQHALDVTNDNFVANNSLGTYLVSIGQVPEGLSHLEEAVRITPGAVRAQTNLGFALSKMPGRLPEALTHLQDAVRIDRNFPEAQNDLGVALLNTPDRQSEALSHLAEALRLKPDYADAHSNLASALLRMPGRLPEAVSHYEAALRIEPNSPEVHYDLGVALSYMPDRLPDAIEHFQAALRISPDADTHYALATALLKLPGRGPDAVSHLEAALRMNPNYEPARQLLAQLRGR
jgi:tetratricopeptide (TPR) repeat protein